MTNVASAGAWDPSRYDDQFAYVSRMGTGLVDLAAVQAGERVLDLGCGTGTLMARLRDAGAVVSGIDGDPEMVRQARELLPDADVRVADGQAFEVDEQVDVVFSNAALHWMPRALDAARCVARALRPGGRFVAEQGGAHNVATIIDAVRAEARERGVEVAVPWYFPTVAQQASVLEEAGLRVSLVEHFARPTPLIGDHGVRDWLRMFGSLLLDGFPADEREAVMRAVEERTASVLRGDEGWHADYWRLRFVAHKPAAA